MAYGFGATVGAATTDLITVGYREPSPRKATYSIWTNRNGAGGGNAGRIFATGVGAVAAVSFLNNLAAVQYRFTHSWNGTAAQWSVPAPSLSVWTHALIEYDLGSTSNVPLIWLNGVVQTVTTQAAPTGTVDIPAEQFNIGNTSSGIRVWDGLIAEFAVWSRFLSTSEVMLLSQGLSPLCFSAGLREYLPLNLDPASRMRQSPGTLVGTKGAPHPKRIIRPSLTLKRYFASVATLPIGSFNYQAVKTAANY